MVNKKAISLVGMAMAMAAMHTVSGYKVNRSYEPLEREDKSYLRKKCKSCRLLCTGLHYCNGGKYTSPQHQACNKYKPKNKK